MKVTKIAMVQVLGLVEDERTFSNLAFMKNKLHNQLTTHFDLCVQMFTQNFTMSLIFCMMPPLQLGRKYALGARQMGGFKFATCIS
jgi:hypothetical protein